MVALPNNKSTNVRSFASAALDAFLRPPRAERPADEAALLAVADQRAVLDGGLRAWSWGDGPITLLVHGWGGRGTQFGALIPALVNAGRRVVTFDAIAHGDTPGSHTTAVAMAEAVAAVAAWAGPVETVVAHSFGAVATTLALSRGLAAARVVLIAPLFHVSASVERYLGAVGLGADDRERFLAALTDAARGHAPHDLDGARLAPRLSQPVLVVHDRDDREVPYPDALAAAEAWRDAHLITTVGLGHRRILGDGHVLAIVRDFAIGRGAASYTLDDATRIERDLADREGRWMRSVGRYV